jgi:hypothetical protein
MRAAWKPAHRAEAVKGAMKTIGRLTGNRPLRARGSPGRWLIRHFT